MSSEPGAPVDPIPPQKPNLAMKFAGGVVLLSMLSVLPFAFGLHVLPSETWITQARPFAWGLGVAEAIVMAWAFWWSVKQRNDRLGIRNVLILLFALPFGFAAGSMFVYTAPSWVGSVVGSQVTQLHTVKKVPPVGDRRCRRQIKIDGMPFLLDEICGVPDEIRARLAPGMRIEVSGRGNGLGLQPGTIRVVR